MTTTELKLWLLVRVPKELDLMIAYDPKSSF